MVQSRRSKQRELTRREDELAPVRKLAFEDITAFGVDLQELDLEMSGHELDAGANADYQRALDAYESAKLAGDSITEPEDIRHITEIVEDGRYAVACVRARVEGKPLPTRRPPCFFDPRHGPSVADVPYVPPDGVERDVPACALDVERVNAGAEPDVRKVMVGAQRVPYWQGGRAYEPYAMGYFGAFGPMTWMFMGGMMFGDLGGGYDGGGDGVAAATAVVTAATAVASTAAGTVGASTAASTAEASTSAASEVGRAARTGRSMSDVRALLRECTESSSARWSVRIESSLSTAAPASVRSRTSGTCLVGASRTASQRWARSRGSCTRSSACRSRPARRCSCVG